tara:strand:+ start:923 stop:1225 length:303 start_codon:yes stop_codon:yes gene_type:complete
MTSSCSFRITRTAEDLAHTINAISQRLVKLEQRQEAIELSLKKVDAEPSADQIERLEGIDQILRDCKELLGEDLFTNDSKDNTLINDSASDSDQDELLVA